MTIREPISDITNASERFAHFWCLFRRPCIEPHVSAPTHRPELSRVSPVAHCFFIRHDMLSVHPWCVRETLASFGEGIHQSTTGKNRTKLVYRSCRSWRQLQNLRAFCSGRCLLNKKTGELSACRSRSGGKELWSVASAVCEEPFRTDTKVVKILFRCLSKICVWIKRKGAIQRIWSADF